MYKLLKLMYRFLRLFLFQNIGTVQDREVLLSLYFGGGIEHLWCISKKQYED